MIRFAGLLMIAMLLASAEAKASYLLLHCQRSNVGS